MHASPVSCSRVPERRNGYRIQGTPRLRGALALGDHQNIRCGCFSAPAATADVTACSTRPVRGAGVDAPWPHARLGCRAHACACLVRAVRRAGYRTGFSSSDRRGGEVDRVVGFRPRETSGPNVPLQRDFPIGEEGPVVALEGDGEACVGDGAHSVGCHMFSLYTNRLQGTHALCTGAL